MDRDCSQSEFLAEDPEFVRRAILIFRELAYLHRYFPSALDSSAKTQHSRQAGHGDFDKQVCDWIEKMVEQVRQKYLTCGSISDPKVIEELEGEIGQLKLQHRDNELAHAAIKTFCFLDDKATECARCCFASNCIQRFTDEHSVYEAFIKSFDFRQVFCSSLFLARRMQISEL